MIQPQTDLGKHQTVQSYLCDLDFFSPVKLKKLPFFGGGGWFCLCWQGGLSITSKAKNCTIQSLAKSFISSIIELDELWLS